jgi:SulP family sulfate permease
VLPDAVTMALLGGIESLLSAVIADGMTGRRHRSNCELIAQGIANIAVPIFGGIPATGTIARTAANIRSGSTSPVSGMLHAVFLLLFMLIAAPLAVHVPLAALAAILMVVAWNMSEAQVVARMFRNSTWGDRVVLGATLLLTVFFDLTVGIQVGVVLAAIFFMHSMAEAVEIESHRPLHLIDRDAPDSAPRSHAPLAPALTHADDVLVYTINGPFFFGAASHLSVALDRMGAWPKRLVFDFSDVPLVDSTGAAALKGIIQSAARRGAEVILAAMSRPVRRSLIRHGIHRPLLAVATAPSLEAALTRPRRANAPPPGAHGLAP